MSHEEEATLNIGALSMATGVPVETIRTWERRYGFPQSDRNDAGHRIYELETIEHLRLITEILSKGYRPSQLEGRSHEELQALWDTISGADRGSRSNTSSEGEDCDQWCQGWMEAVESLSRNELEQCLSGQFNQMGAIAFLERRLGPFLVALGERWANGELSVLHEHFASECIRDFLVGLWRPMSGRGSGPPVVMATLSGEPHCLGLQMASLAVAMAGRRIVFLGADTPVEQVAKAVDHSEAAAVVISVSEYADIDAVALLKNLRRCVASHVDIVVGGRGAPSELKDMRVVAELEALQDYFQ